MSGAEFVPTPSQTVGPYFSIGLTEVNSRSCIAGPEARGERVYLTVRVFDGDELPINDCMIEIWQADASGKYHHPDGPQADAADPACRGFGRMGTDEDGVCTFATVRPGRVPGAGGVLQAPHLNVGVYARGMLRQFWTRVYFAGDPTNAEDPVLALVPAERRETLLAQAGPKGEGHWRFEVYMQGEHETVFFDV